MAVQPGSPYVRLGDVVRDVVTGVEGILTGRFEYLGGCLMGSVQPIGTQNDGKPYDATTFDWCRLRYVRPFSSAEEFIGVANQQMAGPPQVELITGGPDRPQPDRSAPKR